MKRSGRARAALLALALGAAVFSCSEASPPPIPDAEVAGLLEAFAGGDDAQVEAAAERVEAAADTRFVPVLIELLRTSQIGVAGRVGYNRRVIALERLSGQRLGGDWLAWAEWQGSSEAEPPPGFTTWKGELLANLDPAYAELLRDEHPSRLRPELIDWGGVMLGGIPPLDQPAHVLAEEADWLQPEEPVFGLVVNGEARAYPLRILDWHELVNDRLGGQPVSLAYCTLCGSGIAYDASVEGEAPREFSTSGLLYQSNKLMFDRKTRTLWSQLTGRPVQGPLADSELELERHPLVVSTWQRWRDRHPQTTVLSLATGHERDYTLGNPYGPYFSSPQKLFPVYEAEERLPSKQQIYGLVSGPNAKAWVLDALVASGVVNDALGDQDVVLVAEAGRITVQGQHSEAGPVSYDAGATIRAYRRTGERFSPGPRPDTILDAQGVPWQVQEDALIAPDGRRAPRLPGTLAYWFAWQSFHPRTALAGTFL